MVRNLAVAVCLSVSLAAGVSLDAVAAERPLAPVLEGLGSLHMPVTTGNPQAQAFFNQGVRLLYAFNHQESRCVLRKRHVSIHRSPWPGGDRR
jgi:hypothetical protein